MSSYSGGQHQGSGATLRAFGGFIGVLCFVTLPYSTYWSWVCTQRNKVNRSVLLFSKMRMTHFKSDPEPIRPRPPDRSALVLPYRSHFAFGTCSPTTSQPRCAAMMSAHRRVQRRFNAASIDGSKPTTNFPGDPVAEHSRRCERRFAKSTRDRPSRRKGPRGHPRCLQKLGLLHWRPIGFGATGQAQGSSKPLKTIG
jgi:hypothetical protein